MSKFLVFGHQNPDTDAIASSYGWAHLEREVFGRDAEAVALGTPNEETALHLTILVLLHRAWLSLLRQKVLAKSS